ncbi:unnamed protein product [Rotaria sp. Silwood1]|nr:unnamed protein product [Rotaria sp. Silwood1]CAF1552783.1 unnamed protein product [Rotaria sp. Silwood1]CAF1554559.1 unnamed protein product [Rotaria sp. Silwood1]CAF3675530.1 unnamed protein product [Rotaria sp. Silwood1]CAF3773757.1 unnamed protein product [Rotaria sp. Silwood1]
MSTTVFDEGEYVTCPFDSSHKVLSGNFKHHINRCSQNHPNVKKIKCLFNSTHKIVPNKYYDHLCECPDNPAT